MSQPKVLLVVEARDQETSTLEGAVVVMLTAIGYDVTTSPLNRYEDTKSTDRESRLMAFNEACTALDDSYLIVACVDGGAFVSTKVAWQLGHAERGRIKEMDRGRR